MPAPLAKLKAAYRAWDKTKGASAETWLALCAEDIKTRSLAAGSAPLTFTGHQSGKDKFRAYFAGLAKDWQMVHYRPEFFVTQGNTIAVLAHISFRHRGTGKAFETIKSDFFRFKNNKVVEFVELYDTAAIAAAATP